MLSVQLNKKNSIVSFLFLLSLVFSVSAQNMEARKIHELGDFTCEDIKVRLDYFALEIRNFPTAKGFIISYEGKHSFYSNTKKSYVFRLPKFGESSFINQKTMDYLFLTRGLPKDKVLFINGGFREKYTLEFWIVPRGAKSPEITPTLTRINYQKGKLLDLCGEY